MTDQTIKLLGLEVANLSQLKELVLRFSCEKLTYEGLELFFSTIWNNLSQLNEFSFAFDPARNIRDEELKILGIGIGKQMNQLQQLHLDFIENEFMTNEGVKTLLSEIGRQLIQLQRFRFSFYGCPQIKNNGISLFGSEIRNLVNLESLDFSFYRCKGITDLGVKTIALEVATSLPQLQTLRIGFSQLTHEMILELERLLGFIPVLKIA